MEALTGIIDSFKDIIEQIVAFFRDFVKQMRGIGDDK